MRTGPSIFLALVAALAAQTALSGAEVTFSKDVAPILQRSCQNCHRPGSIAPMSLLTYKDARPWARSIKEKVVRRQMPPWHIDRNVGITKFKDDPSLSDAEIATISSWVDQGAPEGNRRRHACTSPVRRPRQVAHRAAGHGGFNAQAIRPESQRRRRVLRHRHRILASRRTSTFPRSRPSPTWGSTWFTTPPPT